MQAIDAKTAENIAICGLQHLAGDDDLLMRFSNITGILPNDMRQSAGQPGFLVGVLDFFLSHEPDLLKFVESAGFAPETVMQARHALAPDDMSGFE